MLRFLVVASAAVVGACGSIALPDEAPGTVGEIVWSGDGRNSFDDTDMFLIHVKDPPDEECGIVFTVAPDALVRDSATGERLRDLPVVLAPGARVAVWYDFVFESCPGQSWTEAIERLAPSPGSAP